MKYAFESRWKNWAVVGLVLTASVYTVVCKWGNIKPLDESDAEVKVGFGLLVSLLSSGLSAGTAKLIDKFCASNQQKNESSTLEAKITIKVETDALLAGLKQQGKQTDHTQVTQYFVDDDKRHADLCNALMDAYDDEGSLSEAEKQKFIAQADAYKNEYPDLKPLQYLAKLHTNGYLHSDIPSVLISKKVPVASIVIVHDITPSTSTANSPKSQIRHFTPSTPERTSQFLM